MKKATRLLLIVMLTLTLVAAAFALMACNLFGGGGGDNDGELEVSFDSTHMVYANDDPESLRPYLTVIHIYGNGNATTITDYQLHVQKYLGGWAVVVYYMDLDTSISIDVYYTATFMTNGNVVGTRPYRINGRIDDEPEVPEKEGYVGAWEEYSLQNEDAVIYAVYKPINYTITYVAEGKTVDTRTYTVENKTVFPPVVPAKTGYTGKWEDCELTMGDVTVNAVYEPNQYTVTLNYNGATDNNTQQSITVTYDAPVGELPQPSKIDDVFFGWYYGDTEITAETIWRYVGSNLTLTARWRGTLAFKLADDGLSYVVNGVGNITDNDIVIPATYNGKPVTGIAANAFSGNSALISIIVPDSITSVGSDAFKGCSSLQYNEQDNALYLGNETNPYVVLVRAKDTSITSCAVNANTKVIYEAAFANCSNLTSIVIPNSVVQMGSAVFRGCSGLREMTLPFVGDAVKPLTTGNTFYPFGYVFGRTNYTGSYEAVQIVSRIEKSGKYSGTAYAYYLPSSLTKVTLTGGNITYGAFQNSKNVQSIVISEGATEIATYAFNGCSALTNISIPDSIMSVGVSAFANCTGLQYTEYGNALYLGNTTNPYVVLMNATDKSITSCTVNVKTKIIYYYAFYNCSSLTSVAMSDSVVVIGASAFSGCSSLNNITIPSGLTKLDEETFSGCSSLTEIIIPNGVTTIGTSAFAGCSSLSSIIIPDSVTLLGASAFRNCSSLTSVTVGNNVTAIGSHTFDGCSRLTDVTLGNNVATIGAYAFSGCSSLSSITIPNSVTSIDEYAFSGCADLLRITLPDSVKSIGEHAFSGCTSLESATIGNGVETIDQYAFNECGNLTNVTFGSGVKTIGKYAFYNCKNLTSLTFGDKLETIGERAFYNCGSLQSVAFGSSVTSIAGEAFRDCDITNTYYTGSLAEWCNIVFDGAYSNPSGNLYINNQLVTDVVIPNGVTEIKKYAFYGFNSIVSVIIPNSVTSIGYDAFCACINLTSVTIGNSVETIGIAAFDRCTNLINVTIGNAVSTIDNYAFRECNNLTRITITASIESIGTDAFKDCYLLIEVCNLSRLDITPGATSHGYVAYYARNVYTSADEASKLTVTDDGYVFYVDGNEVYLVKYTGSQTELTLPNKLNGKSYGIYQYAFSGNGSLTSVIIPDGVTSIGDYAFLGCSSLTNVVIGNGVTSIGERVFVGCGNITSMTLPFVGTTPNETDTTKLGYLFGAGVDGSTNINQLYVPESLTTVVLTGGTAIGEYAFAYCRNLTSITLPVSVTSIGRGAFSNSKNLTNVYYTGTLADWCNISFDGYDANPLYIAHNLYVDNQLVTELVLTDVGTVGDYAFAGINVTSVTFGAGVTAIGEFAFYDCDWLKTLTVANDVKQIGRYAFGECSNLLFVTIGDSVTTLGDYAFSYCYRLAKVVIGNGVTKISDHAFYYSAGLMSVTLGANVSEIGDQAFAWCQKIYEVYNLSASFSNLYEISTRIKDVYTQSDAPSKLTVTDDGYVFYNDDTPILMGYVGDETDLILPNDFNGKSYVLNIYAFYGFSNLTSVVIADGITEISRFAFANCGNLTSIVIPSSVTSIESSAFSSCTSLQTVYFAGTAEQWKQISIGNSNNWLTDATRYYFSEQEPQLNADGTDYDGNYWHWVENVPTIWTKED